MKAHFLAAPVLLAAVFAQSVFAQATPAPSDRPDPAVRHTRMLSKMLNLSADQETQIQGILKSAEASLAGSQAQLKTLRASLLTAIKNNDSGGINAITQQMSAPRQAADAIRATTAAQIYALLTPDQKTKVDKGVEILAGGFRPGFGGFRHGR